MLKVFVLVVPLLCAADGAPHDVAEKVPQPPAPGAAETVGAASTSLNVQDCVAVALQNNAGLAQAAAKVDELQARLAAVRSVYWPKLSSVAFVAPMYTVKGNGYSDNYVRRYRSLSDWGPYTNLEAVAVQPLYTFGRAEAGAKAAAALVEVERARSVSVQADVALEVHRLYFTHLFAQGMLPTLRQAIALLDTARARAQTLYDSGSGEVTQVELAKLDYGLSEARRFCLMAQDGAALALSGLRHVMGRPGDSALQLHDSSMPPAPSRTALEALTPWGLVEMAKQLRPEWEQVRQGRLAARAWERAERKANYPVLFLAGQLRYGHAPTRDTDQNPWHFDNYNTVTGGLAVGLKFDLDPMLVVARAQEARAKLTQVDALAAQATTGMDVQVRRAHADLLRARSSQQISLLGLVATRKWMNSAATAYQSGVGEARDLLEGLAAYVQAKRAMLESLLSYHVAAAELDHAVGTLSKSTP